MTFYGNSKMGSKTVQHHQGHSPTFHFNFIIFWLGRERVNLGHFLDFFFRVLHLLAAEKIVISRFCPLKKESFDFPKWRTVKKKI
jgi:hypothetical protein